MRRLEVRIDDSFSFLRGKVITLIIRKPAFMALFLYVSHNVFVVLDSCGVILSLYDGDVHGI